MSERERLDLIAAIQTEMQRQGRTRQWLAESLGVHRSNVSRMLNRRQMSARHIAAAMDALGLVVRPSKQ